MVEPRDDEVYAGRERGYEIVYNEAIRGLDLQRASLDALRARVGFLLSAATLATSFLGGLAFRTRPAGVGAWMGIGFFVAFGLLALRILWPRDEGADGFAVVPSTVIESYLEPLDGEARPSWALYRDLALFLEAAHDVNRESHLKPVSRWFRASIVLLILEVAVWIGDLAVG